MKGARQAEILRIIAEVEVETQEQLLDELAKRGIRATQATISRDIKQLHLIKELTGQGAYKYVMSERRDSLNFAERLRTIFREGVTSFDVAQNIVVINTMPGLASAAAAALDGLGLTAGAAGWVSGIPLYGAAVRLAARFPALHRGLCLAAAAAWELLRPCKEKNTQ